MNAFRHLIQVRLGFKIRFDELNGFFNPLKVLGLLRIIICIYFRVLATAGPTNLLLVTFLIPLSAILLGVMVLGERLEWNAFVGMGLIFIGLIAIDGRLLERVNNA